ncbi:MAG TPA: hypothetical protein VF805_03815 [Anaeromyxobacteraceae bacterium]
MGYRPRMADVKQMVPGFNHNVKHRGKGYHIQTEDSGLGNPQITTHLFVGGNILATKKTSYADIVTAENLTQVVRELMEEQHKEMLRNLVNGVYDDRDEALSSQARAYQPGQLAAAAAPAAPPPLSLRPVRTAPVSAPPRVDRAPPAARPAPRIAAAAPPPAARSPQVVFRPAMTPPPVLTRSAAVPPLPARPPVVSPPVPAVRTVPPAAPPQEDDSTDVLIVEDLGGEKSLDEVILSYLAGEPGPRK